MDTLFMFVPDGTVQNAWLLYIKSSNYKDKPLDLLGFRQEIININQIKDSTHHCGSILTPQRYSFIQMLLE